MSQTPARGLKGSLQCRGIQTLPEPALVLAFSTQTGIAPAVLVRCVRWTLGSCTSRALIKEHVPLKPRRGPHSSRCKGRLPLALLVSICRWTAVAFGSGLAPCASCVSCDLVVDVLPSSVDAGAGPWRCLLCFGLVWFQSCLYSGI